MNNSEISVNRHEQAESLHQTIMTSGSLAAQNIFTMAKALKEMRDDKLYKERGYQTFESYCEEEVGMKRSNAYNYISIVEKIKPENVQTFGQIGFSKMALLASLSEEKQAEVAEKVDFESVSVRELKEEINKLKGEKLKIENERHKLESKLAAEAASADELRESLSFARRRAEEANSEKDRLEKENKELKARPVEVAPASGSEEERFARKLKELDDAAQKINDQYEQMELEQIMTKRELEAEKQKEIEAIKAEYEQKLREAQAESGEPDKDKQEFKMFLVMAHDALTHLVGIANTHSSETIYTSKAKALLDKFNTMLEVKI